MNNLLNIFEENDPDKGLVPMDVIDFLISRYAKKIGGKVNVKRGYFDFKNFGPEFEEEFNDTAAAYIAPMRAILINVDVAAGKFYTMINAIIHEIFHYNQHVQWDNGEQYRIDFVKGYELPEGTSKDNLKDLDFFKLISFWRDHYGYDRAPHEVEAADWADANTELAIDLVLKREKIRKRKGLDDE